MSELCQQGCEWTVIERGRPTAHPWESIYQCPIHRQQLGGLSKMEIRCNERTTPARMRVDSYWKRVSNDRVHPREPYWERIFQCPIQAKYLHQCSHVRQREARSRNEQSSRLTLQISSWSTSAYYRRQNPQRRLRPLFRKDSNTSGQRACHIK